MAIEPNEPWARPHSTDARVGRPAGTSAASEAHELRRERPLASRVERFLGRRNHERAWRRGAAGERVTGSWLGRLPEGWFAFHDVPLGEGGANIDHLVIGPGGVFTISTKNLAGAIRVSPRTITHQGHRTAFLPKAVAEAKRVAWLLSLALDREVAVRPILAILADEWTVAGEPAGVIVRGPRSAKNLMLGQPAVLRPSDVIVLAAAAARPETWTRIVPPAVSATT